MISYEQVERSLWGYSPEQIGKLLGPALRGDMAMPLSGGRNEEPPEDFFARLLVSSETPPAVRGAILRACLQLYLETLAAVEAARSAVHPLSREETAFLRLCRLINIAKPAELETWMLALLQTQLHSPGLRPEILGACVRAAMAYPVVGEKMGVWNALLARPSLAAYGFQALLSLQPSSERIVKELVYLWKHRLDDGWPTDAALLTLQASRQLNRNDLVGEVLRSLRQKYPQLWPQVVGELQRRSLTRKWLDQDILHQDSPEIDLYALVKLFTNSPNNPTVKMKVKTITSSVLKTNWDSLSGWWMMSSNDPAPERLGTAIRNHRPGKAHSPWMANIDGSLENYRIGTSLRSSLDRQPIKVVNRMLPRAAIPSEMRIADDLVLLEREANAATHHPFLDFAIVLYRTHSLTFSEDQLTFPAMREVKEVT